MPDKMAQPRKQLTKRTSGPVGWGIIGLGRSADTMVCPAVALDPNSRLVAVVSRDQKRAEHFAAKHGATWAGTDYAAMLSNPSVDIVMITTPNAHHAEQVVLAAEAGKHVVCDKPLALSAADARRALDACQSARVECGVMFESRQMPCFQETSRLLAMGAVGKVLLIQADFSAGRGAHLGWRADPDLAGFGAVTNLGVHTFDLLRFLLGVEVTQVVALFDTATRPELEMVAMVLLRFADGVIAYVNANEITPMPTNEFIIHGTEGRIEGRGVTSPGREGDLRFVTRTGDETTHYIADDCWARTVAEFSRALIEGRPFSPSGFDGLRSAELVDAIATSARQGKAVHLPP